MAPAIEAVRVLMESGEPHGDVYLLLTIAEEIGLKGADVLDLQSLNLDFGYVLDTGPPVGTYVNRTGTHDKLDITVYGKPAHAGKDPENGINAMQVAAEAIHGMNLGRISSETTANLGIIEGGTAVNVVCPFVKIRAEARSTSLEDLDRQVGHMVDRFEMAAAKWHTTVEVDHKRHYVSYEISPDSRVAQVATSASEALGLTPGFRTTLGGSDANIFNAKGLPTLVVGTGMQKIHTHEEFITKEDLIKTAHLSLQLLRSAQE
jgi:tripeptide aminopeptidase